jgi:hypothetical protein
MTRVKTEAEIITERNFNAIRSMLEAQAEQLQDQQKQIEALKQGMVGMEQKFQQFKGQVQIMIAGSFSSGPTVKGN